MRILEENSSKTSFLQCWKQFKYHGQAGKKGQIKAEKKVFGNKEKGRILGQKQQENKARQLF